MIVTITIDPAVSKSAVVENLIPEKKLCCTGLMIEARNEVDKARAAV